MHLIVSRDTSVTHTSKKDVGDCYNYLMQTRFAMEWIRFVYDINKTGNETQYHLRSLSWLTKLCWYDHETQNDHLTT